MYDDEDDNDRPRDLRHALTLAGLIVVTLVALLAAIWMSAMQRDSHIEHLAQAVHAGVPAAESAERLRTVDRDEELVGLDVLPGHYAWRTAGVTRTVSHDLWLQPDGRFRARLVASASASSAEPVEAEAAGIWRRVGRVLRFTVSQGNAALFPASARSRVLSAGPDQLVLESGDGAITFDWVAVPADPRTVPVTLVTETTADRDRVDPALWVLLVGCLVLLVLMSGNGAGDERGPRAGGR